jgi:lipopolysaccharide transport system permease protein
VATRDLRAQRARALLAPLWPAVPPLGQALVIYAVARETIGGRVPDYFAWLLLGVLVWAHAALTVQAIVPSVVDAGGAIRLAGMPLWSPPLAAGIRTSFNFAPLLGMAILLAAVRGPGVRPGWVVVAVGLQVWASLAFGAVAAMTYVFFRDVRFGVELVLQLTYYVTPVILPLNLYPHALRVLVDWNPLTVLVGAWRAALLGGAGQPLRCVVLAGTCSAMLLVARRLAPRAMRVSSW